MKRIFLFLTVLLLLHSCARVGSPIGGTKDTLAPKVIGSNIDSSRVNVPRNIKELRIDFDEYITLKDIQQKSYYFPTNKKHQKNFTFYNCQYIFTDSMGRYFAGKYNL